MSYITQTWTVYGNKEIYIISRNMWKNVKKLCFCPKIKVLFLTNGKMIYYFNEITYIYANP